MIELLHRSDMPAGIFPMNWSKPFTEKGYAAVIRAEAKTLIAIFDLEGMPNGWVQIRESAKAATYSLIVGGQIMGKRLEYNAYAIERSKEFEGSFLPLEGSPAQVTWAKQIRAGVIVELMENTPDGKFPLIATKHIFLTRSAHWWIENMNSISGDTLLSVKRWQQEPAFRALVNSLPPISGLTLPMINWASRLRLGCLLSIKLSSSNSEISLLATQLFFGQKTDARWWIENESDLATLVAKGRREYGKSLIRSIPLWNECDGSYQIPDDAPIEEDVAFLQDPSGKWHIFRRELPF